MLEKVLNRIADALFGPLKADDGFEEEAIAVAESSLNAAIPTPLRIMYRIVGNHPIISKSYNRLLAPAQLYYRNDGLVFMEENQNVMFWAILNRHMPLQDPPTQQGNFEEDKWYLEADSLSAFLVGQTCWQAALGSPTSARGVVDDQLIEDLGRRLTAVGSFFPDKENDLLGFYEQGLVVSLSRSAKQFMVGAQNDEDLENFEERFGTGLEWL